MLDADDKNSIREYEANIFCYGIYAPNTAKKLFNTFAKRITRIYFFKIIFNLLSINFKIFN